MTINRRNVMTQTGKALSAALVASVAAPGTASSLDKAAPQHERVRQLARELSFALDEWMNGQFMAKIYPSKSREYPIGFGDIAALDQARWIVSPKMTAAIEAHRMARDAFNAVAHLEDSVFLGRQPTKAEKRKVNRAAKAEEMALTAVCAQRARNAADRHVRAEYLLALSYELSPEQIAALLRSMTWVYQPIAS